MRAIILLASLYLLLAPVYAGAANTASKMEIGARGGIDGSNSSLTEEYGSAEIYFLHRLPWFARFGEQARLTSRFDMGATYLEADDDAGGMLAIGADLVLSLWDDRVEFEVGFRPTWMFDHEYGQDDFGGGMQFTSHAGASFNLGNAVVNYRIQHTSNAGIYDKNPGINLHMIGLGYRF